MKQNKHSKPEQGEVRIRLSMAQRIRNVLHPFLTMAEMP